MNSDEILEILKQKLEEDNDASELKGYPQTLLNCIEMLEMLENE